MMQRAIDVHAHYIPQACLGLISSRPESDNFRGDMSDLARRFDDMAMMGVDLQVISAWQGFFNQDASVARQFNEAIATIAGKHNDRLAALAISPLGEPASAAAELHHAVRTLGLCGVEIGSNVSGAPLDDEAFLSFFEAAAELDVPVFVHPTNPFGKDRLCRFELLNLLGFVSDTALAAASLVFGGVMSRFPTLKVFLAHAGGTMPFLRGRWSHGWNERGFDCAIDKSPEVYLDRFCVDSIAHSSASLRLVADQLGAGRIMLGTDYPYDMGDWTPRKTIESVPGWSDLERDLVIGGNAERMFKL